MLSRPENSKYVRHSFRQAMHKLSVIGVFTFFLTGCAGELAYRSGKEFIAQDKVEEGLAKFKEAMAKAPGNLEYKKTYLQVRDRVVFAYLEKADRYAADGKREDAEKLYQRVLAIDPSNERAQSGLRSIKRDEKHAQLVKEGQLALEKKDLNAAKAKLATVLTENPNSELSRALQRTIVERTAQSTVDSSLAAAYRKTITIEFKDAPLRQVFEVISRTSGLNFLFDRDVKMDQRTSIFLRNSTIESAVHFTLLTNQLEQQVLDANTILIYPNTAAKLKDYQEMVVKSFYLANAEVKTVANTLKTIVKSRDIVVDEKLNMLIVRDSPDAIRLAEKLVALHDVPEPEVMLEVEILEVKRTRLMELGIQWPGSLSLIPLPSTSGGTLTLRDLTSNLNSSTIGASVGPTIVRARKEDGDANLLANPRIRARNHEKAKILIGERVPNITTTATASGFVSESISYVDVGLKLDVEPTIYLDNEVAIKVSLEVSSVTNQLKTQSGSVAYQIGTRTASTVLRLKDGENQVLAGLINDEDRRTGNKVPGLGDLPVVGRLFGSATDDNQKTEIVLSITPRLIRNIQRPDAFAAEFRSGTDSTFRIRPDSLSPAPVSQGTFANAAASDGKSISPPGLPVRTQDGAGAGISNNGPIKTDTDKNSTAAIGIAAPLNNPPRVQWHGPTSAKLGETFTVQVLMQSDQPLTGAPITVGFDTRTLQVLNVTEGIFFKQGGAQTSFSSRIDPNGKIVMTSNRTGTGGATSLGTIANISFRAVAPADEAQISVLNIAPTGMAGSAIVPLPSSPFTVQILP